MNESLKKVLRNIEGMIGKYYADRIFDDLVFITLNFFANNDFMEDRDYRMNNYTQNEKSVFNQMVMDLIKSYDEGIDSRGWYDPLGILYEELSGRYKRKGLGQFFTPQTVVDFMVEINLADSEDIKNPSVNDCACGSGRMLLAYQAKRQGGYLIGEDLDPICARMTAVNMFVHGCVGEVICHNSLNPDDYRFGYYINKDLYPFMIMKIDRMEEKESTPFRMWQNRLKNIKANKEKIEPVVKIKPIEKKLIIEPQLELF